MKPVILCDVDGVVCDFVTPALKWAHLLGADGAHTPQTLDRYDIASLLPSGDVRERYWQRVTSSGFCAALQPYPGTRELVDELRTLGDVVALTSPMSTGMTWAHERAVWLRDHFSFERDHIISTSGKWFVPGSFFADDSLEHLRLWEARWRLPNRAWLVDAPYNLAERTHMPRGSLRDFVGYVRTFLQTQHEQRQEAV